MKKSASSSWGWVGGDSRDDVLFREISMARQRLTKETLASVSELAGAREHVR